ncbi:response regulator [Haloterrigena salinisoli]|uniref:response regulator n=1 Tax=Haloterrigena salinisoli TaxID=3132747 RepID=UPI0030D55968
MLIDPNPEDTQLFLDALNDEKIANHVHTVSDGTEALDFLHQRGNHTDAPRPNLILLDVDLPEIDGYDLLEELTDDSELAEIPVIVLTDSSDAEAVARSYELHTNAFVQKPVDPDEFIDVVRSLKNFWLEIVWLPSDADDDQL